MKQTQLEIKQDGALWVSEPVQMITENAAIQYSLESTGTVKVQRSSVGDEFYDVPDGSVTGQKDMFNITGGVNGLYIRIVVTTKPIGIWITL